MKEEDLLFGEKKKQYRRELREKELLEAQAKKVKISNEKWDRMTKEIIKSVKFNRVFSIDNDAYYKVDKAELKSLIEKEVAEIFQRLIFSSLL